MNKYKLLRNIIFINYIMDNIKNNNSITKAISNNMKVGVPLIPMLSFTNIALGTYQFIPWIIILIIAFIIIII